VKASTLQDYRARLIRVFVHIQRHLDGPLALDDLAGLAGFSPFHFHRVFRGMTGESVQAHIRRLRLERAAQRLKHGGRSILEIALEAGYDSHEAFTRAFKAATSLAPSSYRVHYREDGEVDDFAPRSGGEEMKVRCVKHRPVEVAFVRHVGPYRECGRAWETLVPWLGKEGWQPHGRHHEIYLSDPRRVEPERLKTILRRPVKRA
jgi:AraC family transcriptional regulator